MLTHIALQQFAQGRMIGMRSSAVPIRKLIEEALLEGQEVTIDFDGVAVTQSFVDELVGAIILRHGPQVAGRLVFKGCSEDTRGIIRFVVSDRIEQASTCLH